MTRYISLITLLLVIGILIVVFYKVMAFSFVPLFLAALLVVIFKPFHHWFLKIFKGREKTSAFLTTATILFVVLIPLLALFVLAAIESQQLLQNVNKATLVRNIELTREKLNLEMPEVAEELTAVEIRLDNMSELEQLEDISYLSTGGLANAGIYNDDIQELVDVDYADSPAVQTAWTGYLEEFAKLEDLQARISDPEEYQLEDEDQGADEDEGEGEGEGEGQGEEEKEAELLPESPAMQLHKFSQQVTSARKKFSEFKVQVLGGSPFWIWLTELANPTRDTLEKYGNTAIGYAREFLVNVGALTTSFLGRVILGGGIMIIALYFFLLDGPSLLTSLKRLSPIKDTHEEELIEEFSKVSRAVVVATLLAALVQALLGGIGYYCAGLDSIFLLTLATGCLALVPFVGAAAVWVPCALWLFFIANETTAAIGLAAYGATVISLSDNLIKPLVLHGQSNIHPLFALLSVLGGVAALGPIGILIGPMVVAFLQTALKILQQETMKFDRVAGDAEPSSLSDHSDFMVTSQRLGLRKFKLDDLEAMAAINADSAVMQHFPSTYTTDQTHKFMNGVNDKIDERGYSMWAAELKETGELIGFVGISKVSFEANFTPAVEVGWRLAKKFWGKGYATEAAQACLKFAFEKAGLPVVVAFTATENERSENVMQRIGMTKTGEFDHPKIEDGHRLKKHVLYKISKSDWQATQKEGSNSLKPV